jgi:tetratricopeptide (TPR) repeat protein
VLAAFVACALYVPFLHNPPIFDDLLFFSGYRFSDYASAPLGAGLRFPAYFSLAFVQTVWGGIEAHRIVGLALHLGCGGMLYLFLRELRLAALPALACAALFLLHPAAVYAAGYLMQRTIVMATFFALASVLLYLRGLREQRTWLAVAAACCYSLAVLSKEHAIALPAVALAGSALAGAPRRFVLRYGALYAALCVPAAVLVVLFARSILGTPYEQQFAAVTAEVAAQQGAAQVEMPWIGSAVAQCALFFRYLAAWLFPQLSRMAIDIKVDFAQLWSPLIAAPALAAFAACALAAAWLLWRGRGAAAVAGFGLAWLVILYVPEFAVIRYQEPFVLYRSYLWAPGCAVLAAVALAQLPQRLLPALAVAAALFLGLQARDRLETFSSGLALWEDAAAKLPGDTVPGGWRTLYMLGREYLYAESPQRAAAVVEACIARYPESAECRLGRAGIYMSAEQFEPAMPHLRRAVELAPRAGAVRHHLGWALEKLGCTVQAREQYVISMKLGYAGAQHRLAHLDDPGSGLLPKDKSGAKPRPVCPAELRDARFPPP